MCIHKLDIRYDIIFYSKSGLLPRNIRGKQDFFKIQFLKLKLKNSKENKEKYDNDLFLR